MLVVPYGDENPTRRKPYVNYFLLAANVLIYLGLTLPAELGMNSQYEEIVKFFGFVPSEGHPYTYITSLFLHAGFAHLIGNMLFLFIVGDNVEDKLGHIGYLLFYLAGGVMANVFHGISVQAMQPILTYGGQYVSMADIPTIGASGAISAVLGAYIVLFPKNKVNFFYFFWIFIFIRYGTFKLASFWAIFLWFILQLFSHTTSGGVSSVAYAAHIGGFIFGVIIIGGLALLGVVKAHWHKEQDYLDVVEFNEQDRFRPELHNQPGPFDHPEAYTRPGPYGQQYPYGQQGPYDHPDYSQPGPFDREPDQRPPYRGPGYDPSNPPDYPPGKQNDRRNPNRDDNW